MIESLVDMVLRSKKTKFIKKARLEIEDMENITTGFINSIRENDLTEDCQEVLKVANRILEKLATLRQKLGSVGNT